jgi:hypothetical protein
MVCPSTKSIKSNRRRFAVLRHGLSNVADSGGRTDAAVSFRDTTRRVVRLKVLRHNRRRGWRSIEQGVIEMRRILGIERLRAALARCFTTGLRLSSAAGLVRP